MPEVTLRDKIKLIFPIYAEKELYTLTELTESNIETYTKLIGLEFWGQELKDNKGALPINKKYVVGVITIPSGKTYAAGTSVSLQNLFAVTPIVNPIVDNTATTETAGAVQDVNFRTSSGILLFDIDRHNATEDIVYLCLFEKITEQEVDFIPPTLPANTNVLLTYSNLTHSLPTLEWQDASPLALAANIAPIEAGTYYVEIKHTSAGTTSALFKVDDSLITGATAGNQFYLQAKVVMNEGKPVVTYKWIVDPAS